MLYIANAYTPSFAIDVGSRVQLHPATDAWMRGDRFGEVVKIGRKWISVQMDISGRTLKVDFENICGLA